MNPASWVIDVVSGEAQVAAKPLGVADVAIDFVGAFEKSSALRVSANGISADMVCADLFLLSFNLSIKALSGMEEGHRRG